MRLTPKTKKIWEGKTMLYSLFYEQKTPGAAAFLKVAPSTLKLSRHTGILSGVKAPAYIKRGRSVFYRESTLEEWLSQFEEQANTASVKGEV